MKVSIAVAVLASLAEAVPQLGGMGASWPFVGSKSVKPKYRENAKRVILSYGPITLLGKDEKKAKGSMDPKGQAGMGSLAKGLCSECTLLSGRFLLRYKDGRTADPATGVYIHHMLSFDTGKTAHNPIGGGSTIGNLPIAAFIDRGEDSGDTDTIFTSADGKVDAGFHLKKGKLSVSYDIVNYKTEKQDIYLDLEVEYLPGIVGKDAGHTLKSVSGRIALGQTGAAVTKSGIMRVSEDCTIIWARGHLHAGGDKMVMTVNGKDTCTSLPKYNDQNVITTMGLCPQLIPLKKGDTLQIRSVYDLTKHKLRQSTDGPGAAHGSLGGSDVMGMFAMSYALGLV